MVKARYSMWSVCSAVGVVALSLAGVPASGSSLLDDVVVSSIPAVVTRGVVGGGVSTGGSVHKPHICGHVRCSIAPTSPVVQSLSIWSKLAHNATGSG